MDSCMWVWAGDEWLEHPFFPHSCQDSNKHCAVPATNGTFIGETVATMCV